MYYLSRIIEKMKPVAKKNSVVDKSAKIEGGTQFINSSIGKYSFCGYDCKIINTAIGSFCSIASNVKIGLKGHPLDWVSTSTAFYKGRDSIKKNMAKLEYKVDFYTEIGNDVWIGENAMIKGGVKISDGAVIGMGAVVTKNIGPYEIWAGNPAVFIRKRFDEKTIEQLIKTKWWTYSNNELIKYTSYFDTVEAFLELMEGK